MDLYSTPNLRQRVFPLHKIADVMREKSGDTGLIVPGIPFELAQLCDQSTSTLRQIDVRTDGQHTVALPAHAAAIPSYNEVMPLNKRRTVLLP